MDRHPSGDGYPHTPGPSDAPPEQTTRIRLGNVSRGRLGATLSPANRTTALIGRLAIVIPYAMVTGALIAYTAQVLLPYGDWNLWAQLPARLAEGRLYDHSDPTNTWVWSPLAAWLMVAVVLPMGPLAFGALHVASLSLLRDWRLIGIVGLSFPFWMDTLMANTFTFVAVTGFAAIRGSRWAAFAYLAMTLLMPRPVQLPLVALLLWRDRSLWLPFGALATLLVVTTIGSGYSTEWLAVLTTFGASYPSQEFNLSPTRIIGPIWLVVGTLLAGVLVLRDRSGWAGLAMSPYVLPQYLLVLLFEVVSPRLPRRS